MAIDILSLTHLHLLLKSVVSFERSHASVKLKDIKLITNSSQLKEL